MKPHSDEDDPMEIRIKRKNIISRQSAYSVWMRIGKTHGQFIWSYAVKMSQSKIS